MVGAWGGLEGPKAPPDLPSGMIRIYSSSYQGHPGLLRHCGCVSGVAIMTRLRAVVAARSELLCQVQRGHSSLQSDYAAHAPAATNIRTCSQPFYRSPDRSPASSI